MFGNDTVIENLAEEFGMAETDDILKAMLKLQLMQANNELSGQQQEWLSQSIGSGSGEILGSGFYSEEERGEADYDAFSVIAEVNEKNVKLKRQAQTVVIRGIDNSIVTAFKSSDEDNRDILVEPADAPAEFSAVYGINTDRIWYRLPEGTPVSSEDIEILVIYQPRTKEN